MKPEEVYRLLHGSVQGVGQRKADDYRAKAGLQLRQLRGKYAAFYRWVAANRERIEADAAWAAVRVDYPLATEAMFEVQRVVKDALGIEKRGSGTATWTAVASPGYDVTVNAKIEWGRKVTVSISIRTDADKPVHIIAEKKAAHARYYGGKKEVGKTALGSISFVIPYDDSVPGTGNRASAPPPFMADRSVWDRLYADLFAVPLEDRLTSPLWIKHFGHFSSAMKHTDEYWGVLAEGSRQSVKEYVFSALEDKWYGRGITEEKNKRIYIPMLVGEDTVFTLEFRTHQDFVHKRPDVTLETLAAVITEETGVPFPASPYRSR